MSTEEDAELRDLVAHTLETNGLLGNIRAQLRASVFLALEEQESTNEKSKANKKIKQFSRTHSGRIITCLVYEFLEYFNLDFTLAVFEPESTCTNIYNGREPIAKELNIHENKATTKQPLLVHLLENVLTEISDSKHDKYNQLEQLSNDDYRYSTRNTNNEKISRNPLHFTHDPHSKQDVRGGVINCDSSSAYVPPSNQCTTITAENNPSLSNDLNFDNEEYSRNLENNFQTSNYRHKYEDSNLSIKDLKANDIHSVEGEFSNNSDHLNACENNYDDLTSDSTVSYSESIDNNNYFEDIDPP